MTRRDAVPATGEWAPVRTVMELLSELQGGHCRLVVGFDS